jgi:hypothetical protein
MYKSIGHDMKRMHESFKGVGNMEYHSLVTIIHLQVHNIGLHGHDMSKNRAFHLQVTSLNIWMPRITYLREERNETKIRL